jgi:hypothetical protein
MRFSSLWTEVTGLMAKPLTVLGTLALAVTVMHLDSVWPGSMLVTRKRAWPLSSSVRETEPVDHSLPELRVWPVNAAYDAW